MFKALAIVETFAEIILAVAMILFLIFVSAKFVVAPVAPVATFLAVILLTATTFGSGITAIMSIVGIALYITSWPAMNAWGVMPGMSVWTIGVSLWLVAIYKSIQKSLKTNRMTATT